MKKENKKTAVFYDEALHFSAMRDGDTMALLFTEAKNELEVILEKPIEDYTAFRNDVLGYSIASIKAKFPKAFDLGPPIEKVLAMLSINLIIIETADATLRSTLHKFCVCAKTGDAKADDCKEDFIWYATTDEQHERLNFTYSLITNLEKCHEYAPYRGKHNLVTGIIQFVYFDPQIGLVPNHNFVINGIQQ